MKTSQHTAEQIVKILDQAERMREVDVLKGLLAKSLSIAERRDAVQFLVTKGLSVLRACGLVHLQA